ncbi:M48 family metalloprotease, partial [Candidatus Uhrbacteria bacterium]|nr:M48 family metalloprotease [Candidatus Uhrbacteria bacterium]
MYNQITSNKRRSLVLVTVFIAFVLALGWVIDRGYGSGAGTGGLIFAALISLIMALASFYQGDRLAIWSAGAQAISREENPYLYRQVENLCLAAGLPLPRIHLIKDPAIYAFATGRNPSHASVAVTTGALEKLTNEELEGVLAHELSHIKNYDIR